MSKIINGLVEFFTISSEGVNPVILAVVTAIFTALPFLVIVAVIWVVATIVCSHKPHSYMPFAIAAISSGLILLVLAGLHCLTIGIAAIPATIVDLLLMLCICCCALYVFVQNK